MKHPPTYSDDALFGLFWALLLSFEKRGLLKQSEFIADLDEAIELAKREKFLASSALSEMSRAANWLKGYRPLLSQKAHERFPH